MSAISFLLWGIVLIALISIFIKASSLSDEIEQLKNRIRALEAQPSQKQPVAPAPSSMPVATVPSSASHSIPAPKPQETPVAQERYQPPPALPEKDWEKTFAENWLVWVGGVTLALGGAFLVKYSIDHGLLLPPVRVALGMLLGGGLVAGGEWLARRESRGEALPDGDKTTSQVPQALVAAGSAIIFSSLYAGYQLYGLISSALAFPLLVATAGLTVALSLRRGPFVACLGLIGAFLVPALVHSNQPNAAVLFSYLTIAVAASLLLLRYKSWWWLAWVTLSGGAGWALLWLSTPYAKHDSAIICAFLLVLLALFSLVRAGGSVVVSWLSQPVKDPMIRYVLKTAFLVVSCTLVLIVHIDGYSTVSLATTLFAATLALWLSYRDSELDIILGIAPIPYLAVLLSWFTASAPDQAPHFLIYAAIGALVFGAGGYLAQARAARPLVWSGLSAAVPLVAYGLCYWRLEEASDPLKWALGAALLGAGDLLAALKLTSSREDDTTLLPSPAVTAYVAGALGCSVLAVTIGLQNAWLTMVLALHLPVLGWAAGRMNLPILSRLARLIAVAVLVRLAVNPNILEYPLSSTPLFNWLLYGYGAPAIAFYVAARQFRQGIDEKLVKILEAGAIFFTAALFTFELRHALGHGRMDFTLVDLGADSPQALVWLALATGLFRIGSSKQGDVPTLGGIVLFALATAQCVF